MYFGVHYPHDTFAGVICGIILVILFTFFERFLEDLFFMSLEASHTHGKRQRIKGSLFHLTSYAKFTP